MNNEIKNFRNLKLSITITPDFSPMAKDSLVSNICESINNINVKNRKISNCTTILENKENMLVIVEFQEPTLTKREKSMLEIFKFIETNFGLEYRIETISQEKIKNTLINCYIEKWNMIIYPKYMTTQIS